MDQETLRRWMLAEGLWSRERKRKPHRQRRQRKEHIGELVQMDGSFEEWLRKIALRHACLMNLVDDASEQQTVPLGPTRDDLGTGGYLAGLGEEVWDPASAVYGRQEGVWSRSQTAKKEQLAGKKHRSRNSGGCASELGTGH